MGSKNTVTLTFAGDEDKLIRSADRSTSAVDKFRDNVDKSSTSIARNTKLSSAEVARSMGNQRDEYRKTGESFEDMVNRMIKNKNRLDALAKNAKTLGVKEHPVYGLVFKTDAERAGENGGEPLAGGFEKSATSSLRKVLAGPIALVLAAGLASVAGPIGLTAGGALVAAFGAGLAGLGLAVAARSPEVIARFEKLREAVSAKMKEISKPFEKTLMDIASVAQSVFSTIAVELNKAFPGAAKDISEFVFNLGEAFKQMAPAIGPIMDAFGKILDAIGPQLPGVFKNIADALIPLAETVGQNADGFAKIVVFMLNVIPVALQLITAMIQFGVWWAGIWESVSGNVGKAIAESINLFGIFMRGIEVVNDFFGGILGRFKDIIVTRLREGLADFRNFPSAVKGALGDMGRVLWEAGSRLVSGFIEGIKSKFNEVMGTLRNLTGMIPSWKGPEDVDSKLLTPNGRLIIGSLVDGFRKEEPDVKAYLGDLTKFVGGFGPDTGRLASSSSSGSSDPRPILFGSDGTDLGNAMLMLVAEAVRKAGGDPSVLGV